MSMILLLVILFVFIFVGVPVGFAIGGATMISIFATSNLNMVVNAQYCYSGIFSFTVMAIPFFILAGIIMYIVRSVPSASLKSRRPWRRAT